MNIRTKLILSVGILAGMIILLVALSVVNLQILTATEPDSPAAMPGLERAFAVDFRYRCYLHSCQYRVAGLASPFHQQAYSGIDAWYP